MSELKGKGKPNRDIQAAIGDIYTDSNTDCKYKCTFGYSDGGSYTTEWTALKDTSKNKIEEKVKHDTVASENKEVPAENNVSVEEHSQKPNNTNQQSRKNYTNYSKPKNK